MKCPHCRLEIPPAKRAKAKPIEAVTNTADLSMAELFAYYKRTAPLEDVRFWLNNARMSERLRAGFLALESAAENTTINRTVFYSQFRALEGLWRREILELERPSKAPDVHASIHAYNSRRIEEYRAERTKVRSGARRHPAMAGEAERDTEQTDAEILTILMGQCGNWPPAPEAADRNTDRSWLTVFHADQPVEQTA